MSEKWAILYGYPTMEAYEEDMKRQEHNRIAVELDETLTWDRVATHMRDHYDYDPDDCQLSDVMLSVRKLMRQVVQVDEDDEDSFVAFSLDDVMKKLNEDETVHYCGVCGKRCEGHGEL